MVSRSSSIGKHFYNWLYKTSRFNQYGLKTHDLLTETEAVQEAIRRLPDDVYDERTFRMHRALHYCMLKKVLPKEEWTKADDKDNWYLKDYLAEVEKEIQERKEWAKK